MPNCGANHNNPDCEPYTPECYYLIALGLCGNPDYRLVGSGMSRRKRNNSSIQTTVQNYFIKVRDQKWFKKAPVKVNLPPGVNPPNANVNCRL
jgi:hypothetical protein